MAREEESLRGEMFQLMLSVADIRAQSEVVTRNLDGMKQEANYLEHLGSSFRDFEKQMHVYMAERRRRYNDSLPLHQLPVELHLKIFSQCLQGSLEGWFLNLHTLAQVCSRWAALAMTPSLWGVAVSSDELDGVQRALAMSRDGPVDLEFCSTLCNYAGVETSPFTNAVKDHLDRWRSVEISGLGPRSELRFLATFAAPRLEDLTVSYTGKLPIQINLFQGRFDRIRHLSLEGISVPWEACRLSNLETLRLSYLGKTSPSIGALIDIIRASPSLSSLYLKNLLSRQDGDPPPETAAPVQLPYLKRLYISLVPQQCVHDILAAIGIPHCANVLVHSIFNPPICEHITRLYQQCMVAALKEGVLGSVSISVSAEAVWVRTDERSDSPVYPSFDVHLVGDLCAATIEWLRDILTIPDPQPEVTLIIEQFGYAVAFEEVLPLLVVGDSITSLQFYLGPQINAANALINFLCTPVVAGCTSPWPLPRLHTMELDGELPGALEVEHMMRVRYGDPGEGISSDPPAPLQRVVIWRESVLRWKDIQEMTNVLGKGVEVWTESHARPVQPSGYYEDLDPFGSSSYI